MEDLEIKIPIMVESDQPSELMERTVRKKLAEKILNGKGDFKIRTASGCFNEFTIHNLNQNNNP